MNPYAIIGGLLITIALCFSSAQVGRTLERAEWQKKEIAAEQATKKEIDRLIAKAERDVQFFAKQKRIDDENHQTELAAVKARRVADAGKRVPISPYFCAADPAREASSTGSTYQEVATTKFLPDAFAGDLRQLAADADEVVADLRYLVEQTKNAGCFPGYDTPPSLGENHELVRHPDVVEIPDAHRPHDTGDRDGRAVPGSDEPGA